MELTCPLTTHQGAWLCGFVCSVRFVAACACILVCDTGRLVGGRGKVLQEADALLTLTSPKSNMSAAPHAPHLYNINWVEEDAGHKRRNARCASALPYRQLIDDGRLLLPTPAAPPPLRHTRAICAGSCYRCSTGFRQLAICSVSLCFHQVTQPLVCRWGQ